MSSSSSSSNSFLHEKPTTSGTGQPSPLETDDTPVPPSDDEQPFLSADDTPVPPSDDEPPFLSADDTPVPPSDDEQPPPPGDDSAGALTEITVYIISYDSDHSPQFAATFLQAYITPLVGASARFTLCDTYTTVGDLLDASEADPFLLTAGSVVLFAIRPELATREWMAATASEIEDYGTSSTVDSFCAYQFTDADPLLLATSVQRLLAYTTPLILVDASDWACRVHYPPTIHQVWRNAYGSDVMTNARFLPLGTTEASDMAAFLVNATTAQNTPISARRLALMWVGSVTERKPEVRSSI